MKLVYHLTDEARKRIFVETGKDPGRDQAVEVDPAQLSADDRRLLLTLNPTLASTTNLVGLPKWNITDGITRSAFGWLELNAPTDDPVALLATYHDAVVVSQRDAEAERDAALQALIAELTTWPADREVYRSVGKAFAGAPREAEARAALDAARSRHAAYRAAEQAERTAQVAAAAAERVQREQERAAWARSHGSTHLKKCVESGYDCQRLYVLERAALEHPGYLVDYNGVAEWRERSGPSERSLDEATRVGGTVVWLTAEPSSAIAEPEEDGSWEKPFQPCEAVVISGYLGKYDLIKVL